MGQYNLVRDKVPYLLEKWEKEVKWKSAKDKKYLHPSLYSVRIKEEFKKFLQSMGEDDDEKIMEQMAEIVELFECYSYNCLHTGFPRVLKMKEDKAEREGKYNNQCLLWEE